MPRSSTRAGRDATRALDAECRRLRAELLDADLRLLRAQLAPHFLFNALAAIQELIATDAALAERMTGTLAELLRLSLASAGRAEVPLDAELAFTTAYLALERMRFEDRLAVEVDAPADARRAAVPSMILQPLVENAVRHGICRRACGGTVAVRARRVGDALHVVVDDDGVGLGAAGVPAREGVGLSNTRCRLARRFGARHAFAVRARPEGGTRVEILIPYAELST